MEASPPDGCNGAAFAIDDKIVGADMFDKPATLSKLWPKLVQSYAMDALGDAKESPGPLGSEKITAWLKAASFAKQECFNLPGFGQDVRIEGEQLVGAVLVVEQNPVHMELFKEQK